MLSAVMDGSAGAAAATALRSNVGVSDTTIPVDSTTGFLSSGGVIIIGSEKISYTGVTAAPTATFTGATRGYEGTDADSYAIDRAVYHEDAGIINHALGFNALDTQVPGGAIDVVSIPWNFVTITLPKLLMWDYSFLTGDLVILRTVLMAASVGFVIYLTYMAVNTILGVVSKVV